MLFYKLLKSQTWWFVLILCPLLDGIMKFRLRYKGHTMITVYEVLNNYKLQVFNHNPSTNTDFLSDRPPGCVTI